MGMKFLSRYEPSDAFVAKIADSEVVAAAAEEARAREGKKLSSATDGRKTERVNVPKLQDATFAGTKRSGEASLFLVEGDSARTFAMAGLGALGHDRYGVFPLRGVLLNTREATVKQLIENEEVKHLKTILGLREGHTHAGGEGLRYGSVIALTDADADGTHIRGLILNFIHHKWPALAASGFVRVLQTPVVRATRGSEVVDFVNLAEVNHWAATDAARGFKLRYYKGLGSWTPADAKKLLKDARPIRFVAAPGEQGVAAAQEAIELAFAKDKKEDRKSLILLNVASPPVPDYSRDMTIPDYVRRDWVNFAMYNVERSIPSVLDGLKTSQRKVLWTVIKKNHLTAAQLVKVPVLCGEVMSFTQYLHGEASLNGAIVNMAQDFVGATNLNLLYPNGMFGTRIKNGADASAPRYITTYGTPLLRFVFRAEDDDLYALAKEEGDDVEPVAMWPVLPTLLLTGAAAIATGFSTYVPAFAPADVLANVRRAIAGEPLQSMAPFYRGFEGKIAPDGKGGWTATGVVVRGAGAGQWVVTELPVGQRAPSFNDYDEWLKSDKCAADCEKNLSTDTHARFLVCFPPDAQPADEAAAVAALKLTCGITTTNMHAFAPDGRIKKYASAEEIIEEWVPWRLARYEARRLRLIANSEAQLVKTTNTLRFVEAVIARQIVVQDHEETPLCALLEARRARGPARPLWTRGFLERARSCVQHARVWIERCTRRLAGRSTAGGAQRRRAHCQLRLRAPHTAGWRLRQGEGRLRLPARAADAHVHARPRGAAAARGGRRAGGAGRGGDRRQDRQIACWRLPLHQAHEERLGAAVSGHRFPVRGPAGTHIVARAARTDSPLVSRQRGRRRGG